MGTVTNHFCDVCSRTLSIFELYTVRIQRLSEEPGQLAVYAEIELCAECKDKKTVNEVQNFARKDFALPTHA